MKKYIYLISVIIISILIFYISGFLGFIKFIFLMLLYSLFAYLIYSIFKTIRKQKLMNYKKFLYIFIQKLSLSFLFIIIIIGVFGYYENYISPAKMREITISNGYKIIVFQEMSHIGSQKFYDTIKNNLINYKKQGFVYFYEGVKPGKQENMDKFNQAIGIKFDKDLYKNFSKLYGVTFQTPGMFLGLVNNLDFNVDVDIDWIIKNYEKQKKELTNKNKNTKEIIDLSPQIIEELAKLNDKELQILRFINKAILNALIKNDKAQALIQDNFSNKTLFDIILNGRNQILSQEILNSKYKKIYITYGKLHFPGVFDLLKKSDKNYKIIKIKEFASIN